MRNDAQSKVKGTVAANGGASAAGAASVDSPASDGEKAGGLLRQATMYYGVSIAQTFIEFSPFCSL